MFTYQNFGDVAELRSDTFTLPTDELREATLRGQYGDNIYGLDEPTK